MRNARPRTPALSPGGLTRKRPPATPARLTLGAALLSVCALGAWLTIPRPDLRVMNASGQDVRIRVSGGQGAASQNLGVARVWAVEQDFTAGQRLSVQVRLPDGAEVNTMLGVPTFPLRVAVAEDGTVAPR